MALRAGVSARRRTRRVGTALPGQRLTGGLQAASRFSAHARARRSPGRARPPGLWAWPGVGVAGRGPAGEWTDTSPSVRRGRCAQPLRGRSADGGHGREHLGCSGREPGTRAVRVRLVKFLEQADPHSPNPRGREVGSGWQWARVSFLRDEMFCNWIGVMVA